MWIIRESYVNHTGIIRESYSESYGNPMWIIRESYGNPIWIIQESYVNHTGILYESYGNPMWIIRESYMNHTGILCESYGNPIWIIRESYVNHTGIPMWIIRESYVKSYRNPMWIIQGILCESYRNPMWIMGILCESYGNPIWIIREILCESYGNPMWIIQESYMNHTGILCESYRNPMWIIRESYVNHTGILCESYRNPMWIIRESYVNHTGILCESYRNPISYYKIKINKINATHPWTYSWTWLHSRPTHLRPEDCLVLDSGVSNTLNSDHYVVNCTINFSKPNNKRITSISRNYHNLDHYAFTNLQNSFQAFPYNSNLDDRVVLYNSTVLSVLDNHCPLTTRTHKFKTQPIWPSGWSSSLSGRISFIHKTRPIRQNPNFTLNSYPPLTLKSFSRPWRHYWTGMLLLFFTQIQWEFE